MSSNNEVQYEAFRRHDTTPKAYQPRLCWYSLLVLEVDGENSRNKFFLQYRTVVFITPACARNLNGASASEPSPAPQILKHSLIHPAAIILPQNQTKPNHPISRFQTHSVLYGVPTHTSIKIYSWLPEPQAEQWSLFFSFAPWIYA